LASRAFLAALSAAIFSPHAVNAVVGSGAAVISIPPPASAIRDGLGVVACAVHPTSSAVATSAAAQ
jgi:hypothetical protein